MDGQGNVYIADTQAQPCAQGEPERDDHDDRRYGQLGFSGDGGPATSAQLTCPRGWQWTGRGTSTSPTPEPPCAQGEPRRDDHDDRRHGQGGLLRGRRPGHLGAARTRSQGLAVDGQGNVYIADTENNRVRRVSPGGTITTIAGTGMQDFSGDGGPAARRS